MTLTDAELRVIANGLVQNGVVLTELGNEMVRKIGEQPDEPDGPDEPAPPTSKVTFGIDISEHQGDINLKAIEKAGAEFCFVRVTGGIGAAATRGVWVDENVDVNLKKLAQTDMVPGVYGFPNRPVEASIPTQVDVFLDNAGDLTDKMIAVDYERYEPDTDLTPRPQDTMAYCRELQRRLGPRHLWLYAGLRFWMDPPNSGLLSQYGAPGTVHLWVPRYISNDAIQKWKQHFFDNRDEVDWFAPFAGAKRSQMKMAQYGIAEFDRKIVPTTTGECDVNAFLGAKEDLLKYTETAEAPDPADPPADATPAWVTGPRDYLLDCVGGPYIPWERGRFKKGPPAWIGNEPEPPAEEVAEKGAFCVACHNLAQSFNGIHPPDDPEWWYGGVAWVGDVYPERGVDRPFEWDREWPLMTMFVRKYRGARLDLQGHVWVKVGFNKMMSWDRQFGGNAMRTLADTVALAGGVDFVVSPNNWLRPPGEPVWEGGKLL